MYVRARIRVHVKKLTSMRISHTYAYMYTVYLNVRSMRAHVHMRLYIVIKLRPTPKDEIHKVVGTGGTGERAHRLAMRTYCWSPRTAQE